MLPAAKIAGADWAPRLRAKSPPTGPHLKPAVVSPQPFETQYLRADSPWSRYLRATVLIMVKILPFFLTTLAAISPVVQAAAAKPATCTPGLDYCGWLLIKSKGRGKEAHHETKTELASSRTDIVLSQAGGKRVLIPKRYTIAILMVT
ncbi:hypothetical protein E4U19_006214 [Claviceps sp. Clav32 group G5]|nr:hypothetical protein E4U19_006214 [Claviceps sp. Clav32 group G5]